MIAVSVSFPDAKKIGGLGAGSEGLFRKTMMLQLGQFARDTAVARIRAGIGSDDSPMPPLSRKPSPVMVHGKFVRQRLGYAGWKAEHGLRPIRDMWGSGKEGGHMLDNFTVRSASESSVRLAFTQNKARARALSNERRTPFLSWSDRDIAIIMERAAAIFKEAVSASTSSFPEIVRRALRRAA